MEPWQSEVITKNLPALIRTITCNVEVIACLQMEKILSLEDVNILDARGKCDGEGAKTKQLLNFIMTRVKGFEHLAMALHRSNQSGAFSILLKGIQKHAIFKEVIFEGFHLPLGKICEDMDKDCVENIIKNNLDDTIYEAFIGEGTWILARETIPKALSYYIPRTMTITTELNSKIFEELTQDIFCIEGHELYQLSGLAKGRKNCASDWSKNQIKRVTASFILLQTPQHFQMIAEKATKCAHWVRHKEGKYFYVKSSIESGLQKVKKFLTSGNPEKLSEDDLIEKCMSAPRNAPVLIYDSPGMGKSVLLAELARKMKEKKPTNSVIFIPISELVGKVASNPEGKYSLATVKQSILHIITTNKLGRSIIEKLFASEDHQIELFLDAFDEVHPQYFDSAKGILECLKETSNIRMFITTRLHMRHELEDRFGVVGYNIEPFDQSNKMLFFKTYWENAHGVKGNKETEQYAEYCLKCLSSNVSSDIAGIPLQCKMLADIFGEEAKLGGYIPTESQLTLSSIYEVYKKYVEIKFDTICCTDKERKRLHDIHVAVSLRTLYRDEDPDLTKDQSALDEQLIYRIGLLEPCKSDPTVPSFQHRTFAEFMLAEYLARTTNPRTFMDLLFGQALSVTWYIRSEPYYNDKVIVNFLNFFLANNKRNETLEDWKKIKNAFRQSKYFTPTALLGLLVSSLLVDGTNIFRFCVDLYLDWDTFSNVTTSISMYKKGLNEIKMLFAEKNATKIANCHYLIVLSTLRCSLECLKLLVQFLEVVTGLLPRQFAEKAFATSVRRGHYGIFEYFLSLNNHLLDRKDGRLLAYCIDRTINDSSDVISDKIQIVKRMLHENPKLIDNFMCRKDGKEMISNAIILKSGAHFELIKLVIEAGSDITVTYEYNRNIAHVAASYFSEEEYHQLVTWIIDRKEYKLFKQCDELFEATPLHMALRRLHLKTETLELLANHCEVDFNFISPEFGSELEVAIELIKDDRVISDIIRLGGDVEKLGLKDSIPRNDKWNNEEEEDEPYIPRDEDDDWREVEMHRKENIPGTK